MQPHSGFEKFSQLQKDAASLPAAMPGEEKCYSEAAREDRSAERYSIEADVSMRQAGHRSFPVIIRNISLSGFVCDGFSNMTPGHRCFLKLPRHESVSASVIWNDGWQIGCAFSRLLPQHVLDLIRTEYSPEV